MGVTDLFAGEIATELLKLLIQICRKAGLCKQAAENLRSSINHLLPVIQEIKYSGVELPAPRQRQLDELSVNLTSGLELAAKVLKSPRWNVYKNLQLARKMEKLEKSVSRFMAGTMQAHVLADVHHVRFEMAERFDKMEISGRRLERRLGEMKIGVTKGGGWLGEAVMRVDMEVEEEGSLGNLGEGSFGNLGSGMELARRELKEMVMGREEVRVLGVCGIGGSGKTTLAREICKDDEVRG